jgi:hypothetical protein
MSLRRFSLRTAFLMTCAWGLASAAACGNFSASDPATSEGDGGGVDASQLADGAGSVSDAFTPFADSSADGGAPGVDASSDTALVFVTSATFKGNFAANAGDALAMADQACQTAAKAGMRTSAVATHATFKAWLSQNAIIDAKNHVGLSGPLARTYVLPNNVHTVVFPAGFVFGSGAAGGALPMSAINVDENGNAPTTTTTSVWTGTLPSGLSRELNYDCQHWVTGDPAEFAATGDTNMPGSGWTNFQGLNCSMALHLYCFEAP